MQEILGEEVATTYLKPPLFGEWERCGVRKARDQLGRLAPPAMQIVIHLVEVKSLLSRLELATRECVVGVKVAILLRLDGHCGTDSVFTGAVSGAVVFQVEHADRKVPHELVVGEIGQELANVAACRCGLFERSYGLGH